ncbi:MAG: sigma 54-interacting transcriptional regulator [Labilithrix sp.]
MDISTIGLGESSLQVRAATIHVAKGPDAGRQVKLAQVSFTVGVGDGADLRLTDPAVSREHLRITLEPSGVRVRDPGSKNGTFLGGVRVNDVTFTGDAALTIGSTTLAFTISTDSIVLPLSSEDRFGEAIGATVVMRHLFAQLERSSKSELTVLIEGESGVGKDVLAQAIHANSPRREGPFIVADCGGIPANLIESELFGHERGAFTGADKARKGLVEEANGGTLFLDEVGELPLELQPKLLRMMEQREVRPVGSNKSRPVDVRIVAATNRRLAEAARAGEFRDDLFYRLAVIRVVVPALRERAEDIVPIATAMLRRLKSDPEATIPADFASMLMAYAWPGNVRELRNVVERYAVFGTGEDLFMETKAQARAAAIELSTLPYHEAKKVVMDRFEEEYFPQVLDRAGGVISKAAELAGVARPSFYRMIERVRPGYTKKQSIPPAP